MPDIRSNELPLDLLQAGRDEFIDGTGPVRIVLSVDSTSDRPQPQTPIQSPHLHAAHRELESQSARLKAVEN